MAKKRKKKRRLIPRWDKKGAKLFLGDEVVKSFRRFAPNQELILDVFQEEAWSPMIYNPLWRKRGADELYEAHRLRVTLSDLNKGHSAELIRFGSCKKGKCIRWWYVDDES